MSQDGSIDWACLPRFDSPAVFARILDRQRGGFWQIAPTAERYTSSLRYAQRTAILESVHRTGQGAVQVRDAFLAPSENSSPSVIVRVCEGLSGNVELASVLDARLDYGKAVAHLTPVRHGGLRLGNEFLLSSSIGQQGPEARFALEPGRRAAFFLTSAGRLPRLDDAESTLDATAHSWRDWCGDCAYSGP